MQQEKQFLQDLRQHFRLNIYEVKIWTALLSRGIASAGELADISGVPRSRCYDVLESLEKKGFIIMNVGKPIKYLSVSPQIILERVKDEIKSESDNVTSQIENIKETEEFRELELLHKSGIQHVDIGSISKSLVGRTAINRHIKDVVSKAKLKVTVVATQQHVERMAKIMKSFANSFDKKGIKIRLCAPYSKNASKKLPNAEHKEFNPNSSFINVDNREMIFMVSNDVAVPEYEVAIWILSPFFVEAVNVLFEQSLK